MRVAFYAPMKAPDDPTPSGDRTVGRNLVAALRRAGHEVALASRLRSYDRGDPTRQERLRALGEREARRALNRVRKSGKAPDLWFTYHLYHKAPDWLGPAVTQALGIPYVVAEASVANKQRGGPWDLGYRASLEALGHADLAVTLNPADEAGVKPHLRAGVPMLALPPFMDTTPFASAPPARETGRARLAADFGLSLGRPWLVTVGMMRADQKLASYRVLAEALAALDGEAFELLVVGTGPAEAEVRAAFEAGGVSATLLGEVGPHDLPGILASSDLYVWPAVKEAWSMALIEAQAAGLPVVAGRSGGVATVVADGETALLVPEGDALAFARAVAALLDPQRRARFSMAAAWRAVACHDISVAASRLDGALRETIDRFYRRANGVPSKTECH
ncbi:glycosyltransferase family 4 protein [Jiella marina]|uniref:glycosyltransferase family 4 protein n=1 Tax=Jiella sp. LLJ827 TaxID=2917712 RepID=UPI0021007E1F|nr:glycosyltransferase family 4 protein [Jiella sp. LLJ827]MCQ0986825.1 glycosyltransferase family 4 protein [Jiella sp. LLJ827]